MSQTRSLISLIKWSTHKMLLWSNRLLRRILGRWQWWAHKTPLFSKSQLHRCSRWITRYRGLSPLCSSKESRLKIQTREPSCRKILIDNTLNRMADHYTKLTTVAWLTLIQLRCLRPKSQASKSSLQRPAKVHRLWPQNCSIVSSWPLRLTFLTTKAIRWSSLRCRKQPCRSRYQVLLILT